VGHGRAREQHRGGFGESASIIASSLVLLAGHFQGRPHADGMEYQFGNFLVVVIARRRPRDFRFLGWSPNASDPEGPYGRAGPG
jgi:hypothetical protein